MNETFALARRGLPLAGATGLLLQPRAAWLPAAARGAGMAVVRRTPAAPAWPEEPAVGLEEGAPTADVGAVLEAGDMAAPVPPQQGDVHSVTAAGTGEPIGAQAPVARPTGPAVQTAAAGAAPHAAAVPAWRPVIREGLTAQASSRVEAPAGLSTRAASLPQAAPPATAGLPGQELAPSSGPGALAAAQMQPARPHDAPVAAEAARPVPVLTAQARTSATQPQVTPGQADLRQLAATLRGRTAPEPQPDSTPPAAGSPRAAARMGEVPAEACASAMAASGAAAARPPVTRDRMSPAGTPWEAAPAEPMAAAPRGRPIEPMQPPAPSPTAASADHRHALMGPPAAAVAPAAVAVARPDLSALLAPPAPAKRTVRVDRVQVSLQAPPPPPVAAVAAPAGTPAARHPQAAPARPAYRNPWASYHLRRD